MKKIIAQFYVDQTVSILLLFTLFFAGCREEDFSPNLTREFTLQSTSNGASYNIKVALPADYDPIGKTYGTIYVLDGDENFDFVANHCRELSNAHAVSNVLVVSIGYGNDRNLDYTPTETSSMTGGAPQFLEFIRDQLIPTIEQTYSADRTRNGRAILGHSYGGLFGAYAFTSDNKVFGNYLSLSPSIWYDNEVVLKFEKDSRINNKDGEQLVFMGIGQMENSGSMQAPFEALYQTLLKNYPSIRLAKNQEKDLGHMGSKFPNTILGLTYYFEHRSL
ncbi:hypothetical protein BH09BAC3_BH09BAC3_29550 [soil metagenome]